MRVYLDSSALVKRAVQEEESDAVEAFLGQAGDGTMLVTSDLALVEVSRSLRHHLDAVDPARIGVLTDDAFAGIHLAPMGEQVVSIARRLGPATLRSLDAIHLATAALVDADVVVAYDHRLLAAAAELGFATESP